MADEQRDPREERGELPRDFADAVGDAVGGVRGALDRLFPGHANAALFALVGLVVALLVLAFGFWRMMLVVVLVVAGIAFGQCLDGDPKILNRLKEIFQSSDRG